MNKILIYFFIFVFTEYNLFALDCNIFTDNIIDFVQNINTLESEFIQKIELPDMSKNQNLDLSDAKGKFYIQKPYNFAFNYEYKNGDKLKIVGNNKLIKIINPDLNQINHLNSSEYKQYIDIFSVKNKKEFFIKNCTDDKIQVCKNFDKNINLACVDFTQKDNKIQTIKSISIFNLESNYITKIQLHSILLNEKIDDSVFIVKDPRIFQDEME